MRLLDVLISWQTRLSTSLTRRSTSRSPPTSSKQSAFPAFPYSAYSRELPRLASPRSIQITDGEAPFLDCSSVNATKSASSWDELVALFGKTADGKTQELKQAPALSHELGKIIHIAGHAVAVNDKDAITKQGRHPYCHVSL